MPYVEERRRIPVERLAAREAVRAQTSELTRAQERGVVIGRFSPVRRAAEAEQQGRSAGTQKIRGGRLRVDKAVGFAQFAREAGIEMSVHIDRVSDAQIGGSEPQRIVRSLHFALVRAGVVVEVEPGDEPCLPDVLDPVGPVE